MFRILCKNRALWLGESFFFSTRTFEGKPLFLGDHLDRLLDNIKHYYGDIFDEVYYSSFRLSLLNSLSALESRLKASYDSCKDEYYLRVTLLPSFADQQCNKDMELYFQLNIQKLEPSKFDRKFLFIKREDKIMLFGKSGHYQSQMKDLREAKGRGFDEVIYIDSDNKILEASTSNVFIVDNENKKAWTSGDENKIYSGVTMGKLETVLENLGFIVMRDSPMYDELELNHSIIFTNSVNIITRGKSERTKLLDEDLTTLLNERILKLAKDK